MAGAGALCRHGVHSTYREVGSRKTTSALDPRRLQTGSAKKALAAAQRDGAGGTPWRGRGGCGGAGGCGRPPG